jgi:hypothetical protein
VETWASLEDSDLQAMALDACARNIRWLLDRHWIDGDRLQIQGWAISHNRSPEQGRFLINGRAFDRIEYPISSPDLREFFWNIHDAATARFSCPTRFDPEQTFQEGFARLEFLEGDRNEATRTAWYLTDHRNELPVPSDPQLQRVIGVADRANFLIGGASVYKRIEHYLEERFSKKFCDFPQILDFGCGCGRLARHFRWSAGCRITGVDRDRNLPQRTVQGFQRL